MVKKNIERSVMAMNFVTLETELIEEIVNDLNSRLGVPLKSATLPQLIGVTYHIEHITSWLKDGSSYTGDILTILGMGGIGKTSLANYVYELHRREYTCSFVGDISRRCAGKYLGLLDVQKQLCDDISKAKRCALMKRKVKPKHTKCTLEGLSLNASLELFCHHAFTCNYPGEGYEEVSIKIVRYCDGHPLALEVLGKSLHKRDIPYWEEHIKGLQKEPLSGIEKAKRALQLSYDSLSSENDKELFKHIACFFVGMDKDLTETILKTCDINTRSGITNLMEKCFLKVRWNNELMMHSLIQEMGRDLVRQESPNKPWKRSRLWYHPESFKVLKQNKAIPSDSKFLLISLPSSLRKLSLANSNLSNESFPMDFSSLAMLEELCLDNNPIVSMPSCVSTLPRLEKLHMIFCDKMISIEHPPRVKEKVLHSLGWTSIEFTKEMLLQTHDIYKGSDKSQSQMYYEFGIFSTIYMGKEMPQWIRCRSKGSSISFTVPSSPNKLRGLNFCCVDIVPPKLPYIKISNTTNNRTWIYEPYIDFVFGEYCYSLLSHWMFGPNEMKGGDQITITVEPVEFGKYIKECGIGLVYEDEIIQEEEEDALGYYKSWNYIIGRDLSPFQLTTGAYVLNNDGFLAYASKSNACYHQFFDYGAYYKEEGRVAFKSAFKAFS
ncbi:hypothetical protein M8C21_009162 [Ambrosia artemisiifolia]|uniref:Disease resistance protein Roq1-like winged-helix domain-containing protein n=1 Tax=Ambrosia artemisiifolia TaxID=4212 RepID=A0AAD5GF09_AMBAR|nr:hypothetical protein M8C21_009162 [Ambrosia artemisiifolia]